MNKPFATWILIVLLSACGNQSTTTQPPSSASHVDAPRTPAEEKKSSSDAPPTTENSRQPLQLGEVWVSQAPEGKQLVIEASLDFVTDDVRQTVTDIEQTVEQLNGIITQNEIVALVEHEQSFSQEDDDTILKLTAYTPQAKMTVRIPNEHINGFLNSLQKHIQFLREQNFESEDIGPQLRHHAMQTARQQALMQALKKAHSSTYSNDQTEEAIQQQFEAQAKQEQAQLQYDYWQERIHFATFKLTFEQAQIVKTEKQTDATAIIKHHQRIADKKTFKWLGLLFLFIGGPVALALGIHRLYRKRQESKQKQAMLPKDQLDQSTDNH